MHSRAARPRGAVRHRSARSRSHGSSACARTSTAPTPSGTPEGTAVRGVRRRAAGSARARCSRELRDAYQGHTPVALIDGEDELFARPAAGAARASPGRPCRQALPTIAEQLAEPVDGRRADRLPAADGRAAGRGGGRLARPGPAPHPSGGRADPAAERHRLLASPDSPAAGSAGSSPSWSTRMSGTGLVVEPIIEATLEVFSEGVTPTHRRLRKAATWYRDYPNAGGNPKLGLILLSGHFRAGGDSRTHAERYLVRALLADLDDAYTGAVQRIAPARPPGRPRRQRPGHGRCRAHRRPVLRDRADGIADRVVVLRGAARRSATPRCATPPPSPARGGPRHRLGTRRHGLVPRTARTAAAAHHHFSTGCGSRSVRRSTCRSPGPGARAVGRSRRRSPGPRPPLTRPGRPCRGRRTRSSAR